MSRKYQKSFIALWLIGASLVPSANAQETIKQGSEPQPTLATPEPAVIYLWAEGNIPAVTKAQANSISRYADPPDFRPSMKVFPAKEGMSVKGAVMK